MINGGDGRFYTLGLSLKAGRPELYIANANETDAYRVFGAVKRAADRGWALSAGLQRLGDQVAYLGRVPGKFLPVRMPAIRAYYGGDRPVLQIVQANREGFLPWETRGDGAVEQILFSLPSGCVQ